MSCHRHVLKVEQTGRVARCLKRNMASACPVYGKFLTKIILKMVNVIGNIDFSKLRIFANQFLHTFHFSKFDNCKKIFFKENKDAYSVGRKSFVYSLDNSLILHCEMIPYVSYSS